MPFAGWLAVRWKSQIPLLAMGVVFVVAFVAVFHFGALEVTAPKRSFLSRFWPVEHPEQHAAALLALSTAFVLFLWYALFDIGVQPAGWHSAALPDVAHTIFFQQGAIQPLFVALALYPVVASALAAAYLLGAARLKTVAWVLFALVIGMCILSGIWFPQGLWLLAPAAFFAYLSARAA